MSSQNNRAYTDRNIEGVKVFPINIHEDDRGILGVLDWETEIDFVVKRAFYIKVNASEAVRAEHSVSAVQILVAITGSVTIDLDNGRRRQISVLNDAASAIRIDAGIWRRLRDFAPGTVLMVLASKSFNDTEIFDTPRPDLLGSP